MAKGRIKPNFWQIFAASDYKPNDGTPILWSQGKEEGVFSKAQELSDARGQKVHIFEVYKNPPMSKGLDRYELFKTVHPTMSREAREIATEARRNTEVGKALLEKGIIKPPLGAAELGYIFRTKGAELAQRAVWAILQSKVVDIADADVDELEEAAARAVDVAFETKTVDEAIDLTLESDSK